MHAPQIRLRPIKGVSRCDVLKASLAASVTLSALPLYSPATLWGAEAGQPRRGGVLRVRGWDPMHFDPHQTLRHVHWLLAALRQELCASPQPQYGGRAAILWLER